MTGPLLATEVPWDVLTSLPWPLAGLALAALVAQVGAAVFGHLRLARAALAVVVAAGSAALVLAAVVTLWSPA